MSGELPSSSENEKLKEIEAKKEHLSGALRSLNEKMPHTVSAVGELVRADEKELAEEVLAIDFYNSIQIVAENLSGSKIGHDPGHSGLLYLRDFLEKDSRLNNEKLHQIGVELVKLYARYQEAGNYPKNSASLYEAIGMKEQADQNKGKPNRESAKIGKYAVVETENESWERAVLEFREKVKDLSPFNSVEEKDAALEKLKTDIQDKINSLS